MSSEQHHLQNRTAPQLHPTEQHPKNRSDTPKPNNTSPSPQLIRTSNSTPPLPPRRHHTNTAKTENDDKPRAAGPEPTQPAGR
ncbi:hypothetical protein QL285_074579 [Trifolium repens]|nr:hypothetical protein QL285_074579 [Trifolium repens]